MRLSFITIALLSFGSSAAAQDRTFSLNPSSGPSGTVVAVNLQSGESFTPDTRFVFSFGDDLASTYSRVPIQVTWVHPFQVTLTIPANADCGTHYFSVLVPVPARPPEVSGRRPFDVTSPCNPLRRNSMDVLSYNIQFLSPDLTCSISLGEGPSAGEQVCDVATLEGTCPFTDAEEACSRQHYPGCRAYCECVETCGKDRRVDLLQEHPDLRGHDVIVFQEAFSDSHRLELRSRLRAEYRHQSQVLSQDHGLTQDGGVMVFSKWPIEWVAERVFSHVGCDRPEECLSDKGIQYVRINKGGQLYHIFGTHTRAGKEPRDAEQRRFQLEEMKNFMALLGFHPRAPGQAGEPIIIAGDFNIDRNTTPGDYQHMLTTLNAVLPEPVIVRDDPQPLVGTNQSGNWIDFVLYRYDYLQPSAAREYVIKPRHPLSPYKHDDLSDHYAVLGRFIFNTPGAEPPGPTDGDGRPPGPLPGCTATIPTQPPVLSGPRGCFASPLAPNFSWSPVPGASEYKLGLADTTDPANEFQLFYEVVKGTSLNLPFTLSSERRYRWKVKGQNCAGPGPFAESMYFTISSDCRPPAAAPVPIAPRGCVDAVRPMFSWQPVPGATSYRIVAGDAWPDNYFVDEYVTETSFTSPLAFDPQKNYRFKVRAENDAGSSPWSEIVYFTPFCGGVASTITTPVGCIATQTPTFSWTPVPHANQYWLLVGSSPDFSAPTTTRFIDVHTTATSVATPPGLLFAPQTTYYAKVKTIMDPASTTAGAWSPTVSFKPLCPPNDAVIVSQSVPAAMAAGQRYNVSVTVRNTGTRVWTSAALYRLGPWPNDIWGVTRVELPSQLAPGEQVTFDFIVRAPSAPGVYTFQWRMVEELVEWFGQATPAVAVSVYAPIRNDASRAAVWVPTAMAAGGRYNVSVRMRNNGLSTWTAAALYRLGPASPQFDIWGVHRVELPKSTSPDTGVTFDFAVTAPSTPGTYVFQWRMVEELVEWFGLPTLPVTITVYPPLRNDASLVKQIVPRWMTANGTYYVSLTLRNNGTSTWTADRLYRLGPWPNDIWGVPRLELPTPVPPGAEVTFTFAVKAPSLPGSYIFQWRMVEELVEWFGQVTTPIVVNVAPSGNM